MRALEFFRYAGCQGLLTQRFTDDDHDGGPYAGWPKRCPADAHDAGLLDRMLVGQNGIQLTLMRIRPDVHDAGPSAGCPRAVLAHDAGPFCLLAKTLSS